MLEGGDRDSMLDSAWTSCNSMQNWPELLSPPYHTYTPKNRFSNSVFKGSKSEYLSMVETLELSWNWHLGFPGGTSGKELTCQCRKPEIRVPSLGKEDPLEKETTTHSNILTLDRGAWWATAHGVAKSQTRPKRLNMHKTSIWSYKKLLSISMI